MNYGATCSEFKNLCFYYFDDCLYKTVMYPLILSDISDAMSNLAH